MNDTHDCDYTRPGAEPWWACCTPANAHEQIGHTHAA